VAKFFPFCPPEAGRLLLGNEVVVADDVVDFHAVEKN